MDGGGEVNTGGWLPPSGAFGCVECVCVHVCTFVLVGECVCEISRYNNNHGGKFTLQYVLVSETQ